MLRHIYEPFFTHGKKKGTGLGMATVKKIVDEHGGSLEVISEVDEGTQVIVTLPRAIAVKPIAPPRDQGDPKRPEVVSTGP